MVIGFDVDPILGVRPYVEKACCMEVENKIDERLKVKILKQVSQRV